MQYLRWKKLRQREEYQASRECQHQAQTQHTPQIGNIAPSPKLRCEHRRTADDPKVDQVQQERDLARQPNCGNRGIALLPYKNHTQQVQPREHQLLNDDRDRYLFNF